MSDYLAAHLDATDWSFLQWSSYRSERYKLVYVATPKVACTSLKWWFARLEGYSQAIRGVVDSAEADPDLIIHDSFHKVAPNVAGLPPEVLAEALASDTYFKFAVVRNPYRRIFSAWQSKLMLREPLQVTPYLNEDFFNRPIASAGDVASAFESFLEHLKGNESPSFWDLHWTPQVKLLRPDIIKYSRVDQIENTRALGEALIKWLGAGIPNPFSERVANESLIPYQPGFITERSAELIRTLYAEDFEAFQYNTALPQVREHYSDDQFAVALKAIAMLRGRHERIGAMRSWMNEKDRDFARAIAGHDSQMVLLKSTLVEINARRDRDLTDALNDMHLQISALNKDLNVYRERAEECDRLLSNSNAKNETLNDENIRSSEELTLARAQLVAHEHERQGLAAALQEAHSRLAAREEERQKLADVLRAAPVQINAPIDGLEQSLKALMTRHATELGSIRFLGRRCLKLLASRMFGKRY